MYRRRHFCVIICTIQHPTIRPIDPLALAASSCAVARAASCRGGAARSRIEYNSSRAITRPVGRGYSRSSCRATGSSVYCAAFSCRPSPSNRRGENRIIRIFFSHRPRFPSDNDRPSLRTTYSMGDFHRRRDAKKSCDRQTGNTINVLAGRNGCTAVMQNKNVLLGSYSFSRF